MSSEEYMGTQSLESNMPGLPRQLHQCYVSQVMHKVQESILYLDWFCDFLIWDRIVAFLSNV